MGNKRGFLVILIIFLAVTATALSAFPIVCTTSHSGWTGDSQVRMGNFSFQLCLGCCVLEILSLLFHGGFGRVIGIMATLVKAVGPWVAVWLYNEIGEIMTDVSWKKTVTGNLTIC